jgi:hypothetical protein
MATTLLQMGTQGQTGIAASSTQGIGYQAAVGSPNFATTVATPPYLGPSGNVLPFIRFVPAAAPLTNATNVVDVVMPLGPGAPGAYYAVLYTVNATPALT